VLIVGAIRTPMPGLIDAHTHIMFATVPQMKPILLLSTTIVKDGEIHRNTASTGN
jgi:predicted amidohydrolase YtcJ